MMGVRALLIYCVLTYMATLAELIDQELVNRWNVSLSARQQPERTLFLLPGLASRLDGLLATAGSTWNIEETPAQQLDALTASFVAGEPLVIGHQVKYLDYHKRAHGVWYLKTANTRVFGWFPMRDHFIAASIGIAEETKSIDLYHGFGNEVAHLRDQLPLDDPKFVPGDDPNAVVSNFSYPY